MSSVEAVHDLSTPRGRRAVIIAMCRRRQRPGSGSSLVALKERGIVMHWPDVSEALASVEWAVVGAVATRLYMPERVTADLDILVATADFPRAEERLAAAGWERTGDISIGGSTWRSGAGEELDLLHSDESWVRGALTQAAQNRDADGLPVIPLPYLVLLKLRASRTLDIGDVARMLGLASLEMLAEVRAATARYAPEDSDDVDALAELGKLEWGEQTWD